MKQVIPILICVSFALWTCDGGGGGGSQPDVAPDQTAAETSNDTGGGSDLPDLTGRVYRFSRLETYLPTDMFNSTWTKDLSENTIVILLRVHSHDTSTDAINMSVVSGTVKLDPETGEILSYHPDLEATYMDVVIEDGAFEVEETFIWDITTTNLSRPLHLVDLTGHGEVDIDGNEMRNGMFVGGLLEEDMKTLCMGIVGMGAVNLQWFLTLGGICPDRDTDGDGVADAYTFDWHFDAIEVTDLYSDEPLHVIPWVTDCTPHMEGCPESD